MRCYHCVYFEDTCAKVSTMETRHQQEKLDYTLLHPHRSAALTKCLNHVVYWKHGAREHTHPEQLHQQGGCAWSRPLHHRLFCVCHRDSGHNWKFVSNICLLQVSLWKCFVFYSWFLLYCSSFHFIFIFIRVLSFSQSPREMKLWYQLSRSSSADCSWFWFCELLFFGTDNPLKLCWQICAGFNSLQSESRWCSCFLLCSRSNGVKPVISIKIILGAQYPGQNIIFLPNRGKKKQLL